jgi:hypothetical protein
MSVSAVGLWRGAILSIFVGERQEAEVIVVAAAENQVRKW